MKKLFLATTALFALTGFAVAADLPLRRAPPLPVVAAVPVFTWTGFYIGVNAGAAFDHQKSASVTTGTDFGYGYGYTDTTATGFNRSSNKDVSFTGGGQIGYNWQYNAIVFGIEADAQYLGLDRARNGNDTGDIQGVTASETLAFRNNIDWFGTVRGRLGFLLGERLLAYGTAGFAYANGSPSLNYNYTYGDTTYGYNQGGNGNDFRTGWTAGAGVEYALSRNWSLKAEYLYVDLGSTTVRAVNPALATDFISVREKDQFSVARAGLNYRF